MTEMILIVDDNPQNLQLLGKHLNNSGYALSFAMSGVEALSFLRDAKQLPMLILLDIMMPEMDGIEVCRELKKDDRLKHIPIIFLSAKSELEDIIKGFNAGGVDYITKPFFAQELLARIKTHIELKKAYAEITTLRGILPICANCHKIRDDQGFWQQVEQYIQQHIDVQFSHGICPECMKELYPEIPPMESEEDSS